MHARTRFLLFVAATLGALLVAGSASAAWPTDPAINVPVETSPTRPSGPHRSAPDSCGGIILAWTDAENTVGAPFKISVQRVDAFGQPRWALNGLQVSPDFAASSGDLGSMDIASDDAGGAYVTWSARVTAATRKDIFVQHVLSAGLVDPAWPTAGLPVCSAPGDQDFPRYFYSEEYRAIVPDGAGGAVVAWVDARGNVDFAPDIFAQRVTPTGGTWWTADGVPVVEAPGDQSAFVIAPDGSGGIFAAFVDGLSGSRDIFAQRLDGPTGTRQWVLGGQAVCTAPGNQYDPAVASDGGRLFVAWADERGSSFGDIYAQALGLSGVPLWAPNGSPLCVTSHNKRGARIVSDGLGGAIVGWLDHDPIVGINDDHRAQRVGPLGTPLWAVNGLALCSAATGGQDGMEATSDRRNGAIFTWRDGRNGTNTDIYAQHASSTGLMLWGANGTAVTTAPNPQQTPTIVPDGAGGAVMAWWDLRGADSDIYAQEVGATGSAGVRAASKNCEPDFCGSAYVDFGDAPEGTFAYVSGSPGNFPTCLASGSPGTQETSCGAAPSSPPGPTGYVRHDGTNPNTPGISLGCGPMYATFGLAHGVIPYKADLNGPSALTASPGVGTVLVDFNPHQHSMRVQATFSGLLGTTTASHIHSATLLAFTGNAGVATTMPSFPGFPLGVTAGTYDHTFDMTLASSYNSAFLTAHGGIMVQAEGDLLQSFADGKAYFNIHTTAFGGGEVRGYLVPDLTQQRLAVDTELDGTVNAAGAPPASIPSETSVCSPGVTIYEYERGGGGLWFGADEVEGDGDAGLAAPQTVLACAPASLFYKAWSCGPSTVAAYLNVLVDWSLDGDWNDVVSCGAGTNTTCVPEWAVKNAQVQLAPGCNSLSTPIFNTGPNAGQPWMRMTLTLAPVGDEFPWAGSANVPGGSFIGGETEDYPLTVAAAVLAVDDAPVPSVFALGAVRPNPMREAAELRFSLARAGSAALDVFDLSGRRVRSVAAGVFSAGSHVERWDGRDDQGSIAPSGFYFARLSSDGQTITRPLIRLK